MVRRQHNRTAASRACTGTDPAARERPRSEPAEAGEFDLEAFFGGLRLDEIGTGKVAAFRASLVEKKVGERRINNILSVRSKPMRYAVDCQLIDKAPRIGLYKVEGPERTPSWYRSVASGWSRPASSTSSSSCRARSVSAPLHAATVMDRGSTTCGTAWR